MPADHRHVTRSARGPDRAAVWVLVQEFAESFAPEAHSFSTMFDDAVDDPGSLVLVAESGQRDIVGYLLAHLHPTFNASARICWVEEVMVAAQHQRTGIGRALMSAAESWARENQAAYVCLFARRADGFYLAADYEESASFYRKVLEPE